MRQKHFLTIVQFRLFLRIHSKSFSSYLLSFFSPFVFSLSSTLYPLPIHQKRFGHSPSKNLEMQNGTLINWVTWLILPPILHPKLDTFFWNSSARIWSIFKMGTRMDGSVLAVLAAYQNNL